MNNEHTEQSERAEFERWICEDYFDGIDDAGEFDEGRGIYKEYPVHLAWMAWRAAATLLAADKPAESGGEWEPSGASLRCRRCGNEQEIKITSVRVSTRPQPSALPAEVVKDAERYRWLRNGDYPFSFAQRVLNDTPLGIDAAIDAAMLKEGKA